VQGNVPCSCAELNAATEDHPDRVGLIADASPACQCEAHSMSAHSPGPVDAEETIVRMVCIPEHVRDKRPELAPNFFNRA